MEALIVGLATAFNFIILKWKVEAKRYEDATLDVFVLIILTFVFGGTLGGMVVAMVASVTVSLYLLLKPPKFASDEKLDERLAEAVDNLVNKITKEIK